MSNRLLCLKAAFVICGVIICWRREFCGVRLSSASAKASPPAAVSVASLTDEVHLRDRDRNRDQDQDPHREATPECEGRHGGMQKGLKKYFVNMDEYLANLGLYRKMVARDASSLFRAVSEQLYYSQNYHHTIRQDCANFMRANASVFEPFVEGSFEKYLERLEDPKESVGQVEIKALSQLYRRCFLIYRYPGKAATVISEGDFHDRVTLSCSINGHYDIVYPRSYVASAALCQSVVYELLYTKVFGWEEAELSQAAESFRAGARRYRNSPSASSDVDFGYDIPEERGHREEAEPSEERPRATEDVKPLSEAPPPSRLCLPYKVMKSLDGDIYRNVEFDVWQDTCKEMQKTDYMVFAGRQYFLGDKCQVRLEPKGKYFNAFIQEVGTHSSAVTVFIEELGEKHLVPLTDLKPVNPVPAWNVSAPTRKGELDTEARGHQRRHRYFRKSRGGGAVVKGAELAMPQSYGGPAPSPLPPRFQPAGHPRPPLPPGPPAAGAAPYDPYAPPHQHAARPPRYGAPRGSTRFVNRHLIGPQFSYYPPGRRYYDYDGVAFRSRRSRRHAAAALAKECHFFNADEAPAELDAAVPYFHVDDAGGPDVFATLTSPSVPQSQSVGALPPPSGSPYHVQRGSCPLPLTPPGGGALGGSSEEDLEDPNAVDERDASYQTPIVYTSDAAHVDAPAGQDQDEACVAESPPRADLNYSFPQQVVKPVAVISSSPSSSSSSSSSSRLPASATHAQPRSVAMAMPAATPWLVNELGDGLCSVVAPPPYSYDPSGADLPRDCRLLQFYFNLGVQWYHQSCWQPQQAYSPDAAYPYQHYVPPYGGQEAPLHAAPHSYLEFGRGPHQVPAPYPDSTRMTEAQMDGLAHPPEGSSLDAPAMYPDQMAPPPVPHLPYEAPPPAAYLSSAPPPTLVHSAPHSYHAVVPASAHWGGHASRVYCPAPNPAHVVGYITAPSAHFLPPSA
ncbi:putative bifunctional UDP-N-acetylglucosamine transferase and deubiquitinase ALG13 isoform X2 [Syngnathoides biaculeatus]|uniref:putative bifunctional UDP-N-acetylglucosamine transferase and deubiquitinase ALG13 isoform X2 n=1 Tax=Syngnathoides biaculeatus TaxID=300417 RepID=UPI002ADE3E1C|nr:putative bifunctional UDP-N-acetylglucosamine transferase and deubiquitinase ALG13 isoform X2 [Syngnathoides biaculeatus]